MTALFLQDALCAEIEQITSDMPLMDPTGAEAHLKAYKQTLPIKQHSTDAETNGDFYGEDLASEQEGEDPYPYCIVRIVSGITENAMSPQNVRTLLIFGIYDAGMDAQGHTWILNIIQRIQERFRKNPVLAGQYVMQDRFEWSLQDEDTYPYYFAGIDVTWDTASVRREDAYS